MTLSLFDDGNGLELQAPRPELPALQGTPKQLQWAAHVRKELLAGVDQALDEYRNLAALYRAGCRADLARQTEETLKRLEAAAEGLRRRTQCSWWLNRRDNTPMELLEGAAPKPGAGFVPEEARGA